MLGDAIVSKNVSNAKLPNDLLHVQFIYVKSKIVRSGHIMVIIKFKHAFSYVLSVGLPE